jgi:predicted nucleic-acid-binding Zn-ribbon protein
MNAHWKFSGDKCPKCGSTKTAVKDFNQDYQDIPGLMGDFVRVQTIKPNYDLFCEACKYTEHIEGLPVR